MMFPPQCHLVVPLGQNPAALTEAAWKLAQSGVQVQSICVILESQRAHQWFRAEIAGDDGIWEQLRQTHPTLPPISAIQVRVVGGDRPDSTRFAEALFSVVRQVQDAAAPMVLTLSGGRWRGSASLTTTVFQLLADDADLLVDVRVSDLRVEGGTGFYFPSQPLQSILIRGRDRNAGATVQASSVSVHLDAVSVPRLRRFLMETDLSSYRTALETSQRRLESASSPTLLLDLDAREIRVNGTLLAIPKASWPYYAWLIHARKSGARGVATGDVQGLYDFLQHWRQQSDPLRPPLRDLAKNNLFYRLASPNGASLLSDLETGGKDNNNFRTKISRSLKAVVAVLAAAGLPRVGLLTPKGETVHIDGTRENWHILRLEEDYIEIRDPSYGADAEV